MSRPLRMIQIMTDYIAPSLRDLVFTTDTVPVIDELAALDRLLSELLDELERHAVLFERLPPILDLRGRALVHTRESERFLVLAEADPPCAGEAMFCLMHQRDALSFQLDIDAVARSAVRIDPRVLRLAREP